MLLIKYCVILLIGFFVALPVHAECKYQPDINSIKLTVVGFVVKWGQGQCVAVCEKNLDKKDLISIYFQHCPEKGATLSGNIHQRSDITIEQQAPCFYEFRQKEFCTQDQVMAVAKKRMRKECLGDTDCHFEVLWKANSFPPAYNPQHEWEVKVLSKHDISKFWVSVDCGISE